MLLVVLLCVCVVHTLADVEHYRTLSTWNGVREMKDLTFNEKEGYATIEVRDVSGQLIRMEFHDFKTGYAAMKGPEDNCRVSKNPFTLDTLRKALAAAVNRDSTGPPAIYMTDLGHFDGDVLKVAGPKIAEFCGALDVFKSTPKMTRSKKPSTDARKKWCFGICIG